MLKIIRKTIDENEKLITELDKQIDLSIVKYQVELQQLQTIDGVGRDTAITLISEIGIDMNCFENELGKWVHTLVISTNTQYWVLLSRT